MQSIQATGKTVDAAIFNGLKQLGLSIDEVTIEVVQHETKGILGIGAKPAIVTLTQKPADEVTVPDFSKEREFERGARRERSSQDRRSSHRDNSHRDNSRRDSSRRDDSRRDDFRRNEPRENRRDTVQASQTAYTKPELEKRPLPEGFDLIAELDKVATLNVDSPAPRGERRYDDRPQRSSDRYHSQRSGGYGEAAPAIKPVEYSEEAAKTEPAAQFVDGLLKRMKLEGKVLSARDDEAVRLRVDCGEMGVLIGHRGETLDAVQYLTSLVINRNRKTDGYTRVTINTEDYREKREETLVRLARRIAQQVKSTGAARTLEPMNPYERRIIHSALQKNPFVTTASEGDEPNRRVVISPKRRSGGRYRGRA